jgi:pilus assembly protein Flp/PilA
MTALVVYLQNTVFNLKERQEGQTMAEYALILGGIAVVVIAAIVFLGGRITDLFRATGSSITNPVGGS